MMSKPGIRVGLGKSMARRRVLAMWHPAYRWHELHIGSFVQLREPSTGMKIETSQAQQNARTKVEMASGGSDPLIGAMKAGNAARAKERGRTGQVGINRKGGVP